MPAPKILNVDDKEVNRYLRSAVLREAGYQVVEAASGEEALRLFVAEAPQLVLLDLHLPDIDGREVCRLIKARTLNVTAVVLHVSAAYRDSQTRVGALEGGADGYLAEPVEPDLLVATVRSLLRLRKAEEQLFESQSRLNMAIEAGQMGLWELDTATQQMACSSRMREIIGLPSDVEACTFEEWTRWTHPDDRKRMEKEFREAMERGTALDTEYRLIRPEGGVRWVATKGQLLVDAGGQTSKLSGVAQDVTKRKRAEEDLVRSNEDLNQFAYAASHDLQEPLRAVSSYAQLLAKRYSGKLDPDADDYVRYITEGASRMQRLIQDLLAYSQSDGAQVLMHPVDTTGILLFALSNLQVAIQESCAKVTFGSLPSVMIDSAQLVHLFQNLIGNAIKYRGEKPPEIHVSGERREGEAIILVADNGIGFEPKYAERIFGVFKRLHGRDVPGTGIGLALCRKIVQRQGGRIWAESIPGEGSTFYFALPAERD